MIHLDADLAVTLKDDRPGTLAKALSAVSAAGINIDGYAELGGVVHLLSEDLARTHDCLVKAGFLIVQEQDVVVVSVEDEPGAAARVFQRIAEQHINIRYSYLATGSRLVIAAENRDAVVSALSGVVEK